jgi:hypothetical protein
VKYYAKNLVKPRLKTKRRAKVRETLYEKPCETSSKNFVKLCETLWKKKKHRAKLRETPCEKKRAKKTPCEKKRAKKRIFLSIFKNKKNTHFKIPLNKI